MISNTAINSKKIATFELLIAGLFWGLSFPLSKICLNYFTPLGFGFFRPFLTFIFGEILFFIFYKRNSRARPPILTTIIPGFLLATILYTNNICLHNTTSSMCAFLTCLYAVEVLLINKLFLKYEVQPGFYWSLVGAVLGIALLTGIDPKESSYGILLGLLCSFASSAQIIYMNYRAPGIEDVLRFNNYQQFWSAIILLPGGFFTGFTLDDSSFNFKILISYATIAFFVGVVAFSLQVRAQKILTSHLASLLFLLESPFAIFFSFLLLGEILTTTQYLGGIFVFGACLGAVFTEKSVRSLE